MGRCKRCQLTVRNQTSVCPLCNTVLTKEDSPEENGYPDIRKKTKVVKRLISIMIYFLIVAEIVFCVVNYYTLQKMNLSWITGVSVGYIVLTLLYSFNKRNSHIRKIFVQWTGALLLMLLLDIATGSTGWSLALGLPCAVLGLDLVLVVLMLADFNNWQSYLLVQLVSLVISLVTLVLYWTGITKNPVLPWISFGVTAIIFSFCLLVGNRKAKNELRRRFYV
ncbi:MAG: DUF6320 domain-containing protein [Butyribacter sp.]|nr:DUF6320 domain-containing protein [bacterium]MDY3855348.1 DUF6320 domain-containing protein [Butyribacter sp.]